jgi:diguanylate cyclase (GGDEF)-like protein
MRSSTHGVRNDPARYLVKLGKSKKAMAREAELAAEAAGHAEAVEAMYNAAMARAELAETAQLKADERLAAAMEREQAANERVAAAEAREADARERVAAAEAREADADERVAAAELRIAAIDERLAAVSDRVAAVAEREQAIAERIAAVQAREAAVAERDAIANERDRAAAARDAIANERDRAAIEREAAHRRQPTVSAAQSPDDDGQDPELERARLEAQLQRAHLDSLTGAFRREMGRLALRNEIERARRSDGRFVIAFVDVDGLKSVNDREGHAAGDKILRTLAATMRANLRSYDPIVRYGGDEFVCGIASIDTDEVEHRIGVIDQSLRSSTGVGVTAGLATLSADESLEELTARADAALLEAKRKRDAAEG